MTQVTTGQTVPPGADQDTVLTFAKDTDRNTTYKTLGAFIHPGSKKSGLPTRITAIAGVETADSMDVRVYDVSNRQVIAEVTGVSQAYPSVIDLGQVSNVSLGPAIWELQFRRGAGTGQQTVSMSTATLEY